MSEVKITVSRVSVLKNDAEPEIETTKHGWVRSRIADRMTAWHLRELVRALDAQAVPDGARVTAHKSDVGHATHLTVEWSETLDDDEEARADG